MEQELFSTQEAAKKLGIKPPAFRMKALRAGFEPAKVIQGKGSPQKFWTAEQIATIAGNARADVTETDISTVELAPVVITLDERANRIRALKANIQRGIFQIGFELIAAKEQVGHGNWSAWLETEFSWTQRTANNFMRVAERFGKMENVFQFQPSALQAMLTLPEGDEQEFIDTQAAAGTPVEKQSAREVQKNVKQFKQRQAAKKDSDNTEPVDELQPVRDVDAEEPTLDLSNRGETFSIFGREVVAEPMPSTDPLPAQVAAILKLIDETNDDRQLSTLKIALTNAIILIDAKRTVIAQKN